GLALTGVVITASRRPHTRSPGNSSSDVCSSDLTIGYQWQVSADGSTGWSNVASGGTSSSYTPSEADEGKYLHVVETATDADNGKIGRAACRERGAKGGEVGLGLDGGGDAGGVGG